MCLVFPFYISVLFLFFMQFGEAGMFIKENMFFVKDKKISMIVVFSIKQYMCHVRLKQRVHGIKLRFWSKYKEEEE